MPIISKTFTVIIIAVKTFVKFRNNFRCHWHFVRPRSLLTEFRDMIYDVSICLKLNLTTALCCTRNWIRSRLTLFTLAQKLVLKIVFFLFAHDFCLDFRCWLKKDSFFLACVPDIYVHGFIYLTVVITTTNRWLSFNTGI